MRSYIFILGLATGLFGCLESDFQGTDVSNDNFFIYVSGENLPPNVQNDPFTIVAVNPSDTGWNVILEYPGGCENHSFLIWWDEKFTSSREQTNFQIFHNSNADKCQALVRDTLLIDLDRVFRNAYLPVHTLIKVVNGHTLSTIPVDQSLAKIPQSIDCILTARLGQDLCLSGGIWGDSNNFIFSDSTSEYVVSGIYLQPIGNSQNISLDTPPPPGVYQVGVSLMFGFQSRKDSALCVVPLDQTVVPVILNCISSN